MTVHSMPWPREHSLPRAQTAVDAAVWRSLDAVLCPAAVVGRELERTRGMLPGLLRHVPYGVDRPRGDEEEARRIRTSLAPDGAPLVAMVSATTEAEKGHAVFAEAIAAVEGIHGLIIGPHPGDGFARHLRELGVNGRLTVEGPFPQVASHYRAVDALVLPSTAYECLPLVILEAMAAEKPVIASRLSGVPEAVADGETGFLFEPGDVEGLTGILRHVVDRRNALPELGRRGAERWEREFSVPVMSAKVMAIYEGAR
jgi:glycosyltransferase involved in cell wall biosynthesis